MGSSSLSQRATRQRRPRRLVGTAAAAALLLALAAVGAAAAEESPTALDICLEGKGDAPLLMLDWAEPTILAPGCACELLPPAGGDDANADTDAGADPQPTTAAVRPGDDARVFLRLLQPSARLACSPGCGRVTVSSVEDGQEWVLPEGEGLAVRGLEKEGSSAASCGGSAVAGFAWSGSEGTTTLHALTLRAETTTTTTKQVAQTSSLVPRAAALLLFVGLNVAAAAVSSSSSASSPR